MIEAARRGETILLVDDEELIVLYGRLVLEKAGYRVLSASSGEEAVSLFREKRSDISLAIIDMVMPGIGGIAAVNEILSLSPDTPVIISSSYEPDYLEGGPGPKATSYLPKNYSPEEMLELVRRILAGK